MEAIRPVPRTLLRDRAYETIRDAIVAGEIEPGAVVRDAELAERLGLSRAPVRDAFSRLVDEGLLESKPQSYTRVTPLVASDVRDAAAVVGAMPAWICRVVRRSSERKLISRAASASPAALPSTVTGRPAASTLASVFSWMTLVSPLVFL